MPFVSLSEFPTFGRVATWEEWLDATASCIPSMLFPWFCSNMLGFGLLWLAVMGRPRLARQAWGVLMILASVVNAYFMLFSDPTGYHEFGVLAVPPLQHFIYSKYFANPACMVLTIALLQNMIGVVLLLTKEDYGNTSSKWILKAALVGAIVWFFGLTPLGLSSAFPSSLVYASTMMMCWPKEKHTSGDGRSHENAATLRETSKVKNS